MKIIDFVGRDIRVNDNIVWPVQHGHRISMRRGRVVRIHESGSLAVRPVENEPEDALVSVRRTDNVVVLA